MSLLRQWLPLALPVGVLVVGMATYSDPSQPTPRRLPTVAAAPKPRYTRPPDPSSSRCSETPQLADALLLQGQRLGIRIISGQPELAGKDASYRAEHGRLGTIVLKPRPMSAVVRCKLISHEFIHVLQHLNGQLKGVETLGWGASSHERQRHPIPQEAEAYQHQDQAGYVLQLLKATPKPSL